MDATRLNSPAARAGRAFVGRARELAELLAALDEAVAGRGRLILVRGEPGIGKTRLAEEASTRAADAGAEVAWGRCWQGGGAPVFWPWVQVIRACLRNRPDAQLAAELGACAPFVAHLVPELRERLPDISPVPAAPESEEARFALVDGVTRFLASAAGTRPLVLVLDDLHAADPSSLLLLQFLARELRATHLLVVGTLRDVTAGSQPDVATRLGELSRDARHLSLRGLEAGEVASLLEQATGSAPAAGAAASIHRATGGNPLFLQHVIQLLGDESASAGVTRVPLPPGVREATAERVSTLPRSTVDTLTTAAVAGEELFVPLLQEASQLDVESLLTDLSIATDAGLLIELPGTTRRFRFAHVLIRDALYDALDPARRLRLHREVGLAIERLFEGELGPQLAALAHHFCRAAPSGDVERGVGYAMQAAEHATASLAYEDSAKSYELALETLELADNPQPARRCDILLGLAAAEQRAGHAERSRDAFARAAAVARELGDGERLARAAAGFGAAEATVGAVDERAVELLEESLERLPSRDSALRARLLARLARALYFGDEHERSAELCRRAVEVARVCDDPGALLEALCAQHVVTWNPDNLSDRLRSAHEIVALAEQLRDREASMQGHLWRRRHLLEAGDALAADHETAACERLAGELRQPRYLWQATNLRAGRALLAGRFSDGEKLAREALELGRTGRGETAEAAFLLQMRIVCSEQGRLEEIAPRIDRLAELHAAWRLEPLYHLTKLDRRAEVRAMFERLAADGFDDLPRDMFTLWSLAYLAEACAYLRDRRRAALLYDRLRPYGDRCLVMGQSGGCEGALARHLGQLAATLERWEEAAGHFERALELHTRLGARPLLAHTQHEYAAALLERGRHEDREHAGALLDEALATAEALGMTVLADRIRGARGPSVPACVFRREGEYWTIAFEGSQFRLKDERGLAYIARLLARPNEQIHVLELTAAGSPAGSPRARSDDSGVTSRRLGLGDAGEVLDAQAKAAYRSRLADLQAELDEARDWGDPERAEHLAVEIDALTRELARAVGLRGRDRRAASPAERARISATKAIKRASTKIAARDTRLGDHLRATIRTGAFCSYAPGLGEAHTWETRAVAER
jgi:AAA ATPase-like protein